jgi:hypothetical protein
VTKTGDPIVAPFSQQIAVAMGVPFRPSPAAIISYMLDAAWISLPVRGFPIPILGTSFSGESLKRFRLLA